MYQLGRSGFVSVEAAICRSDAASRSRTPPRVLARYLDGIMVRTFAQKEVEDLAKYADIPIINGLTDYCHPCQVLADLLTIREFKGGFDGLKMLLHRRRQ